MTRCRRYQVACGTTAAAHAALVPIRGVPVELANVRISPFGPITVLIVVLSSLGTAAWLISEGYGIEGTFLGTVDIASLAAVFVLGLQPKPRLSGRPKEPERTGDIQPQSELETG